MPNVWNLAKLDPLLIECFTENVTDIVLSGYPTENDIQGMKFILDVLTRGHVTNIVLKFPSYCLMNILLPLFIYPRSYSLSYLSTGKEADLKPSNIFTQNYILPRRNKKACLEVQIHSIDVSNDLKRILSTHDSIFEDDDQHSIDTTRAIVSNSMNSFRDSIDLLPSPPNTAVHVHSSILQIRNDIPEQESSQPNRSSQSHAPVIDLNPIIRSMNTERFVGENIE